VRSAADEGVVGANPALFASHFGGEIPYPLAVRQAPLPGGRRALLFSSDAAGASPLLVVADAAGRALWHKDRPLAGTHEVSRGLTVTGGPEGSVLVFWWDATSRAVAGRRWQWDGSIFADFHLLDVEDCTGLDALHWPNHGWVVTAVGKGRAQSALLHENGFRGFGDGVVDVGGTHDVLAPVAAAGGIDGVFHAYVGRERSVAGAASPAPVRLFVTLRREDGAPVWPAPVDLGPARASPDGAWPAPRIELVTPARARVTIDGRASFVHSDGKVQ